MGKNADSKEKYKIILSYRWHSIKKTFHFSALFSAVWKLLFHMEFSFTSQRYPLVNIAVPVLYWQKQQDEAITREERQ